MWVLKSGVLSRVLLIQFSGFDSLWVNIQGSGQSIPRQLAYPLPRCSLLTALLKRPRAHMVMIIDIHLTFPFKCIVIPRAVFYVLPYGQPVNLVCFWAQKSKVELQPLSK